MLENFHIDQFQNDLLHWFERNLRDLPWRRDRDPYKVWVSEIMLQQTRVDTVIPYFERFMERFPTLYDLSIAEEEQVLKLWEGLGYYSRARNLHAGVKEVQAEYGGKVPDTVEDITKIKGVGPYTAGAILSIAYGKPEPAVDGNVMRVLSRLLYITEDIQKVKTRKLFEKTIRDLIAKHNPSYFNQALMELGALICTPKSPKCDQCPVRVHCRAKEMEVEQTLPVKTKAKPPKPVYLSVALLEQDGRFFIRRRPATGLLAGLWELPNFEGTIEKLQTDLISTYGLKTFSPKRIAQQQHTFSHLQWDMEVFSLQMDNFPLQKMEGEWIREEEIANYTFPVSYQKIFARIQQDFKANNLK